MCPPHEPCPCEAHLGMAHTTPVASQVNITLLDINDNHPTWKDAPYYINLVEMTPPDSDVTTVSGAGTGCLSKSVCHPHVHPWACPCGAHGRHDCL